MSQQDKGVRTRELLRLRKMREEAKLAIHSLDGAQFQRPQITLPIGEALAAARKLEAWLEDAIFIVENELYNGPLKDG